MDSEFLENIFTISNDGQILLIFYFLTIRFVHVGRYSQVWFPQVWFPSPTSWVDGPMNSAQAKMSWKRKRTRACRACRFQGLFIAAVGESRVGMQAGRALERRLSAIKYRFLQIKHH